jgi:hypothetical protein
MESMVTPITTGILVAMQLVMAQAVVAVVVLGQLAQVVNVATAAVEAPAVKALF